MKKDNLGFILSDSSCKDYVIYEKEDEEYIYEISLNYEFKSIGFYKIKKLTATNYKELFTEVNQPHKAEVWLAPVEVVKLALKRYDELKIMIDKYCDKKRA